jgi:hypothetical protein
MAACIISTAQHANPKVRGHKEPARAQEIKDISFEEIQWLWKANFVLGGVLGLFIIMMQGQLQESDAFLKSKSKAIKGTDISIFSIIANHKMQFMLAVIINGMLGGGYHFLIIFLGTFLMM